MSVSLLGEDPAPNHGGGEEREKAAKEANAERDRATTVYETRTAVLPGGPATVCSLLCVAETRATRPNGEWGYSTRRQCWATSAQRRCHPEEALYLPTFSHLFDCQ